MERGEHAEEACTCPRESLPAIQSQVIPAAWRNASSEQASSGNTHQYKDMKWCLNKYSHTNKTGTPTSNTQKKKAALYRSSKAGQSCHIDAAILDSLSAWASEGLAIGCQVCHTSSSEAIKEISDQSQRPWHTLRVPLAGWPPPQWLHCPGVRASSSLCGNCLLLR